MIIIIIMIHTNGISTNITDVDDNYTHSYRHVEHSMDDDSQPQLIAIQNKRYKNNSYRYCNIKSNLYISIQYLWLNLTVVTLCNLIYLNKKKVAAMKKKLLNYLIHKAQNVQKLEDQYKI